MGARELRTVAGAAVPPAEHALLAALALRIGSLEDVVRRPDLTLVEVIVQDEYTHDVVVAARTRYLVFDTT